MEFFANISPLCCSVLVSVFSFAAFLYQLCVGRRAASGWVSLIAISLSFLLSSVIVFPSVWGKLALYGDVDWFSIGTNHMTLGVLLDNKTVLMQLLVTFIALLVHVYSKMYMKGDKGIHRYWMYLSLFCSAMLALVISKNLLMMYLFWELVGFASYLLIGFWFTKEAAVKANKKAFIVNRIGDIGFLTGISLLYTYYGTLDLVQLFGSEEATFVLSDVANTPLTWIGLSFLLAAMAKSAQFPLHVWLVDAMEGPTSVSSLIHAATMVAAGIFLMVTLSPLFDETVQYVIAIVGTTTAFVGAYLALTPNDIKKVLAFSTISQLGFMMAAVGIGAWDAGFFHLVTHAFFKCLLFLGAGAIIHEMAHLGHQGASDIDPQDMRFMGGLYRKMPQTFAVMAVGALALVGFPLTSGFLSKDAIVVAALEWGVDRGGWALIIPLVLVAVSVMTTFYIARLIVKVFFGKNRTASSDVGHTVAESALWMRIPMYLLALGSLFFVFSPSPFSYEKAAIISVFSASYEFPALSVLHFIVPIGLTLASCIVGWVVWLVYAKERFSFSSTSLLHRLSYRQLYLDRAYQFVFAQGTVVLGRLSHWLEVNVLDRGVVGAALLTRKVAGIISWVDRYLVDGIVKGVTVLTTGTAQVLSWIDRVLVDGLVRTVAGATYSFGHVLRLVQDGRVQRYMAVAFMVLLFTIVYLFFL